MKRTWGRALAQHDKALALLPACPTYVLCWVLLVAQQLSAQELTTARDPVPLPDAFAEPVRATLDSHSFTVTRGTNRIQFWWSRAVALTTTATSPEWSQVPAGALVGAMQLTEPLPDIRGVAIPPGAYTLRFAMQPQDGDHLGVSPYRQFLVVAPAGEDRTSDPLGFDRAVSLGKKTQGRSHPAVLSIDPPSARAEPGSVVTTENGHTAVVITIPASHDGQPAGALTFGLILVGLIEH
jgi:hypothetical protein